MGQLIIKHKVDKSFLKYGFTISVAEFQKHKDLILDFYENKKKVNLLINGKEYPSTIDHGNGRRNLYRLMFPKAALNYFQSKYSSVFTIVDDDVVVNEGVDVVVGFYETDKSDVWEVKEISSESEIDAEEMKQKYQDYLDKIDGTYSGYANAIERDFVCATVRDLYGKSSAYEISSSEDILSLVEAIRTDAALNELDRNAGNRRSSCSLKKYAEFLKILENSRITSSLDIDQIIESIQKSGLIFDPDFVKRYICALLTKPFVILSGLTGSGKTQLAMALPKILCEDESQYKVIPVGADWTNRENLLGYPNAIISGKYEVPVALKLILEASKPGNENKPYFLILDEMNMSYVERYFADFLSAMESHESIPLWDEKGQDVPTSITLPNNLFVVGTINVDETTYMFSPKVLDRANVIEFRINKDQMGEYLDGTCSLGPLEKLTECASDFVNISSGKVSVSLDDSMKETLLGVFDTLSKIQKEFGYRTASEMSRFIGLVKTYAKMSDEGAVDSAIVQKLLPKVHGSRKKVSPILKSLWKICYNGTPVDIETLDEFPELKTFKYPLTAEKIWRMYLIAQDNGFTSFAEA